MLENERDRERRTESECRAIMDAQASQASLTQEQRSRIAQQRELALAKRSAKGLRSFPSASASNHEDNAMIASSQPSAGAFAHRSSHVLREKVSSSDRSCLPNPFRKSSSKPFSPPFQTVIDLEEEEEEEDNRGLNGNGRVRPANQRKVDVCLNRTSECLRPLPGVLKGSMAMNSNVPEQRIHSVIEVRDRTTPSSGSCTHTLKSKITSDCRPENNSVKEGEWRSVRKRSLPGSIFGKVDSTSLSNAEYKNNLWPPTRTDPPSKHHKRVKLALSTQQRNVLLAIASGKSVFLTGSAGTGKSYLLEEAVYTLKNMYGANSVFVTASTGLAACAIGGMTLHSFAGIGLGTGPKKELANKVSTKRDARKRWVDCKALIIDEISMIDGELFDKLEYVASVIRGPSGRNKIFGGIQLVVTGDFFQLPPVQPENPAKYFAFQADCWKECFDLQVELTQVFRQSDYEFVQLLNEIRKGHCSPSTEAKLKSCNRPITGANMGIIMTKLYPRKMDVSKENELKLRSLNQETIGFVAKDDSKTEFAARLLENVRATKELYLSVGAQVMLVKNVDSGVGLVNGARGVVVRFASIEELDEGKDLARKISATGLWPVVLFACDGVERLLRPESWAVLDGNTEVAKRTQIPLVLAWAISVHKCQGMTLDRAEIDLSRSFEYGMVYVALSRVKGLDGLNLLGFDASLIKAHPKVMLFYKELQSKVSCN